MLEATIAEILQPLWLNMSDAACWCEVDEQHVYCCVRPEAILHHPIGKGALFHLNGRTYEVCLVDRVCPAENENWLLIYAHLREDDVAAMPEEEWHELYGDPVAG